MLYSYPKKSIQGLKSVFLNYDISSWQKILKFTTITEDIKSTFKCGSFHLLILLRQKLKFLNKNRHFEASLCSLPHLRKDLYDDFFLMSITFLSNQRI